MRLRLALAGFAAAFCLANALATVTTVREVKTHISKLSRPVTHS
jgi:hypothetical protein